jgi:hypothetical protein
VFIDASEGGGLNLNNCWLNATEATAVIVGGQNSRITDSVFNTFPRTNSTINVLGAAVSSIFSDLHIIAAGQSGPVIDAQANSCRFTNLYITAGGSLKVSGWFCSLSGIYRYAPSAPAGQYAIDLSNGGNAWYNVLNGAYIDGAGASTCHGVLAHLSTVTSVFIRQLTANTKGIEMTYPWDIVSNCQVIEMGSGSTPFVYARGAVAQGNSGYVSNAIATDNGTGTCSVTHDAESGNIEVPVPTAGGIIDGAEYIVMVTNALVNANSRVSVSVSRGTDTLAVRYLVREVQLTTTGFNVPIKNDSGETQNGTWILQYTVTNPGAA